MHHPSLSRRARLLRTTMTPDTSKPAKSLIAILVALTAIGPLGIDMYLPAIPDMARALTTTDGAVQLSLMTFFIGLMLGQLAYGPLSDKFGRKPMIYIGLGIFSGGSIGCALATDIATLQWLRFIQGLGASIGMVIAFAIVKDTCKGPALGKMMSLVLAVMGLCPILAPMAGNVVQELGSWRSIFWVLLAYGVVLAGSALARLPESRSPEDRESFVLSRTFHSYGRIITDKSFVPFALALCIAQAGFFAYIAGSASVFINHFEVSPTTFSLLFAMNALGLVVASILNPKMHQRFGPLTTYKGATLLYLASTAVLMVYVLAGGSSIIVVCAGLFIAIALMGFIMPTGSQLALMEQRQMAGTASALLGSLQFGGGAVITALSGAVAWMGSTGLIMLMLGSALVSSLICLMTFPKALKNR